MNVTVTSTWWFKMVFYDAFGFKHSELKKINLQTFFSILAHYFTE